MDQLAEAYQQSAGQQQVVDSNGVGGSIVRAEQGGPKCSLPRQARRGWGRLSALRGNEALVLAPDMSHVAFLRLLVATSVPRLPSFSPMLAQGWGEAEVHHATPAYISCQQKRHIVWPTSCITAQSVRCRTSCAAVLVVAVAFFIPAQL